MIYNSVTELIGSTPLLSLKNYCESEGIKSDIIAKLELFNPAGSAKDRVALYMILDAEKKGLLKPGSVIIEPTSGNTGIGLACVGVSKGYRVILTMPDTMSVERINLIRAYGAEVVLTEGTLGMAGAITKANELAKEFDGFIPGQFENPSNPKAHYETTGPEIWRDTNGKTDIFVACIGTGGTLTGVGRYLKEKNPDIRIIGVEPFESPLITKGVAGPHKIQGIGANFVPDILDKDVYDEVITIKGEDAIATGNKISKTEGLLVGISSGAAVFAATEIAKREDIHDKKIVALLPDTGEHYLSTDMFK